MEIADDQWENLKNVFYQRCMADVIVKRVYVCAYAKQLWQGATTKLFISVKMKKVATRSATHKGQGHDYF